MNKIYTLILVLGVLFSSAFAAGNLKVKNFNPEENPIDNLALEALLENLAHMDSEMSLVEILSCETQVVSGQNYFLTLAVEVLGEVKEYEAQIYVVPWENNATIMKFEQMQSQKLQQQQMDGGVNTFNWYGSESDSIFNQQKKQIVQMIVSELKNKNLGTNFQVVSAKTQVVSGIKYILEIMVGNEFYNVEVLSQVWNDYLQITSFEKSENAEKQSSLKYLRKQFRQNDNVSSGFEKAPQNIEDKNELPIPEKQVGAFKPINFNEEEQSLKNLVLRGISEKLGSQQHEIQVFSASRRVINGLLYEINFEFDGVAYTADVQVIPYKQYVQVLHLVKV